MSYDMGQALEHLAVLTDHIEASAKMLQRSFRMYGDPIPIQERPTQMETVDNTNERENALPSNSKRKRETDSPEAGYSGATKSLKETEDKSRPNKTECPEAIIIHDKGILISQNIDRITSEKNRGSIILSRVQTDKLDDGLVFDRMTQPSTSSNIITLSKLYVDEFLRSTGVDLTYRKKTVNTTCTCVCLGP